MVRRLVWGIVAVCLLVAGTRCDDVLAAEGTIPLHDARQAADDLEIAGLDGSGSLRYVRHAELAGLPQVTKTIQGDSDFGNLTMQVEGVYLEQVARALGDRKELDLMDALCADNYRSHFPAEYVATHHPILVLRVDGMRPTEWAAKHTQYDPGPYFVTYENFVPAFRVLTHEDEAQLPVNIARITFSSAAKTFGVITPHGEDAAVRDGFVIAKQNCLRCHNSGGVGGTKAGWDWMALSAWARAQPTVFAKYVRDPRSVDTHAHMPGNATYDDATLAALTAYFRTFSDAKGKR